MLEEVPHVWVLTEGFAASSSSCHFFVNNPLSAVFLPWKINFAHKVFEPKILTWNFFTTLELEKHWLDKSTAPPVVAVVTNISYAG